MKHFSWLLTVVFLWTIPADASSVLAVNGGDIYINMGKRDGIQIGTIFNVYRNKEVEADFGNLKFTTRVFVGRVYAYKVADTQTVARIKELPTVGGADDAHAVLKNDITYPTYVMPADDIFRPGKDDVLSEAIPKLDKLVKFLKRFDALKIRIEVHTDEQIANALRITRAQAKQIKSWLVNDRSFKAELFVEMAYGSKKPIATNNSPSGRRTNRRIEIVIED